MGSVVPVFVNVAGPIHREKNPFRPFPNERNPNQPRSPSFLSNLGVSVPRNYLPWIADNIFNLVSGDSPLLVPLFLPFFSVLGPHNVHIGTCLSVDASPETPIDYIGLLSS
ncbi:hypothetical protein [Salinibacter ruber]|uniref:hypothetical protein n=1 Tax=Salinibacter ruber TaxID=146919 RepID=UPI002167AB1D|nr:hypothetical protein [Salinibacter ruber]MCS3695703.1 hypothetical protein [Salinibacter ruber]